MRSEYHKHKNCHNTLDCTHEFLCIFPVSKRSKLSSKAVDFFILSCWNIGYGWPRGYSSAKGTYYSAVLCNGSREGPVPPWLHLLYIDVLSLMARRSMDIQYSSTGFIDAQKREISPVLKHQSHGSPQGKCVSVRWWIKRSCGSWGELTPSGA